MFAFDGDRPFAFGSVATGGFGTTLLLLGGENFLHDGNSVRFLGDRRRGADPNFTMQYQRGQPAREKLSSSGSD
jgi:hypothetical protein